MSSTAQELIDSGALRAALELGGLILLVRVLNKVRPANVLAKWLRRG